MLLAPNCSDRAVLRVYSYAYMLHPYLFSESSVYIGGNALQMGSASGVALAAQLTLRVAAVTHPEAQEAYEAHGVIWKSPNEGKA